MDSLKQSGEKISAQSRQKRDHHDKRLGGIPMTGFLDATGLKGGSEEVRKSAITKDIEPLSSSFMRTAVAGE